MAAPGISATFARNLRLLRVARGMRQGELALRSGVSQDRLSYLELGRGRPRLDELVMLAKTLNVEVGALVADTLREVAALANEPGR